jgi:hypothetical protein
MTHEDKGKYFEKHPAGSKVDDDFKQEIINRIKKNNITCKKAEEIAGEAGFSLEETGRAIDILNVNITKCQLGLFGYGETKKIVQPAKEITPELKESITSALKDGRLSCAAAWEIAAKLNIPRMKVAAACEALQIKIKPCQLGAF